MLVDTGYVSGKSVKQEEPEAGDKYYIYMEIFVSNQQQK